ncbi:MAG: sensor histidine kinase [Lachnospiraceae bacterium]|nr:sensor histidine kinase [Lachnospiraceae bacterium]
MMENRLILLLHLATEFINMTMVYTTVFGASLVKKKWKIVLTVGVVVCGHLLLLEILGLRDAKGMSFFTMLAVPLFMLSGRKRTLLGLYPFAVIMASVVSVSVSFLVANMLGVTEAVVLENDYLGIVCQCAPMLFMGLWSVWCKFKKIELSQMHLDIKQYILFYTVAVCELFMLGPIQNMSKHPELGRDATFAGVAVSVACIVFAVLAVWQGIVVHREIRLQEQNRALEDYMQLQKEYYTDIVAKDEELRRFRHDMAAHTQVIQAYCEDIEHVDLKHYVENMVKETGRYERKVYTGNHGVDAILGRIEQEAKEKEIRFTVEGVLPSRTRVEEYDLCIILSNLLKNAIEACEQVGDAKECYVKLQVGSYEETLCFSVENSVAGGVKIEGNRLLTTKADKKNHGIGSENVARTVEKYGGTVSYQCDGKCFTAEVCISV